MKMDDWVGKWRRLGPFHGHWSRFHGTGARWFAGGGRGMEEEE